ncbi:MAG: Panacea domain-containing protein [Terriglobia bacterium]
MPTSFLKREIDFDFDLEKFLAALHYLAARQVPELDKYKICKLLFLADKYHLVRFGRPILGDRYCPLPHGPVPSHSLDLLNEFIKGESGENRSEETRRIEEVVELDRRFQYPRFVAKRKMSHEEIEVLSKSDMDSLDHVIKTFGQKGFYELKSLTHSVYAYQRAAENLSDMRYEDFFEEDTDAIEGALEQMLEDFEIRRAFSAK